MIVFKLPLLLVAAVISLQGCTKEISNLEAAPYPPSAIIRGIKWDYSSIKQAAPGSDLWPITWSGDGNIYTAWGDGGGFRGTNDKGRVKLGVARILTDPKKLKARNVFGGFNTESKATFVGKPSGLLSVSNTLYMTIVEQDKWLRLKIGKSTDKGKTWEFVSPGWKSDKDWDFAEADGAFSDITFLQFGKDYEDARDDYVYMYSQDKRKSKPRYAISMLRVKKENIMNKAEYEYFSGLNNNQPKWTKSITNRQPVFSDPNTVGWATRVSYNPSLQRYFLTTWHNKKGGWGIFDAPEPWGPWTTVAYYEEWIDDKFKFGFAFPQKWLGNEGNSFTLIYSGIKEHDAWNSINGNIIYIK